MNTSLSKSRRGGYFKLRSSKPPQSDDDILNVNPLNFKEMKKKRDKKLITVYHREEIPETELINCLKFYVKKANKDNCIIALKNFFGLPAMEVREGMKLKEAYVKYLDRLEKKNFS